MNYRKMGKTGLKVSEICLGTMTFGSQVEEPDAINIIEHALEAGINFIDTADVYSGSRSEQIVGKALAGKRHGVVLATKVANRTGPGVNDIGLSRKHLITAIDDSLKRLQTDYVDIYYVHWPDYDTPLDETLRTLDDLVRQGKVRYIACSNFRAWQLCKALWISDVRNIVSFDCIQPPYNLLTRDIEYELLGLCDSEGVGVCAYNPLAAGLLTDKHSSNKPPAEGTRFALDDIGTLYSQRYWHEENFKAIEKIRAIAANGGCNMPQFAIAWVLNNHVINSTICGVTSVSQLEENLKAIDITLSEAELEACDNVWNKLRPLRFFYGR